jgi:hypothetical protein
MHRGLRLLGGLCVTIALTGVSARAQYFYPGGYGAYGWGGWGGGGGTVQGSIATGMGNYAAGAGMYNVETAQARSINAQTAMQWNQYVWESQVAANQREAARMAQRQGRTVASLNATQERLRNNPTPSDITSGDALNVILDELNNPQVYVKALNGARTPLKGTLIRDIPFQRASAAITYSVEQLTQGGPPPSLQNPVFNPEREQMKKIGAQLRKETEEGEPKPETIQQAKEVLKAVRAKVEATYQRNTRESTEALNFIKALYGLLGILQTPAINVLLAGVEKRTDTTVADLLSFMKAYNLRFGVASTPPQQAAYSELFPILDKLRDEIGAPSVASVAPPPPSSRHDPRAGEFFSGMNFDDFEKAQAAAGTPKR